MKDYNKRNLSNSDIIFIKKILSMIEKLKEGVIAHSYLDGNVPKSYTWWIVSISDFDLYFEDVRFKSLSKVWHNAASKRRIRLVFCFCKLTEEKLVKLLEEDNLILNV